MTEQAGPQFTTHRVRRGYNRSEVDGFLSALMTTLGTGGQAPVIAEITFTPEYGGYDEREVDTFLDDLAGELGQS